MQIILLSRSVPRGTESVTNNRFLILVIGIIVGIGISLAWGSVSRTGRSSAATPASPGQEPGQASATPPSTPATPYLEPNGDCVLFDFEDPEQVGRFVYGGINTFIEPATNNVRTGKGSCAATFYVGAQKTRNRAIFYTLMHPARGRLTDWSPFTEFQASIFNDETFTVNLDLEYGDGSKSLWRRYSLPPKTWSQLSQPLADLSSNGVNLSGIKRISWSQLDTDMVDINALYIDDVKLVGADPAAAKKSVEAAWAEYEQWDATRGSGHTRAVSSHDPERPPAN